MKVIIVGAGLLGISTAYFLRRGGADVSVVERRPTAALETSFANGGMLHASQSNPWNEPGILTAALKMLGKEDAALLIRAKALPSMLGWGYRFIRESRPHRYADNLSKNARLARFSIRALAEIRDHTGIEFEHKANGTIKMFRDRGSFEQALQFCHRFDEFDIPYEILEASELVKLEPALDAIQNQLAGGMYFPSDEIGDAHKYCQTLYRWCEENGVNFMFDTPVAGIETRDSRVVALNGLNESSVADNYVIACGSYSPIIARSAGVKLPINPVKGYSITVPVGDWLEAPNIAVIDEQMHAAVCPLGDSIRVAGTAEFAGYDNHVTPSRVGNLVSLLKNVYPSYGPHLDENELESWTGLRPMTYDGVGITGVTSVKNLFVNSGHGHLGWTMAPGAGKALAAMMLKEACALDTADYAMTRFS